MKSILTIGALTLAFFTVSAQNNADGRPAADQDADVLVIDDIRFASEQFLIDSATHTATVTLSITSLNDKPRELKINVYGTQLVDNERNAYYFSTMALGRVLMRFEDKQNYMHYLLQPDVPATLTITADAISARAAAIQVVKIVFEDSTEEGRFLEAYLAEPAPQQD